MNQKRIYLSPPSIGETEIKEVVKALKNGWVAPVGPELLQFEEELMRRFSFQNILPLNSGTSALHLAVKLAGVKVGDRVVVGSFTFIAAANVVLYEGGMPIFIDSEYESWNLNPELLNEFLIKSIQIGQLPKAVILTHIYGRPAKVLEILEICEKYGVMLIEDAAEALGTYINGQHVGTFGEFGVLSFNGNKIITTGGGGALITREKNHLEKARNWASQAKVSAEYYEHTELGYNYALSNVLAAIGLGQLKRFEEILLTKHKISALYSSAIASLDFVEHYEWREGSNDWIFPVLFKTEFIRKVGVSKVIKLFERENIEARRFWKPLHLQPLYAKSEYIGGGVSQDLFERGICLPSGVGLNEDQILRIIDVLKGF